MIRRLVFVFVLGLGWLPATATAETLKKVLIIGIDGCRFDAIEAAQTPNLDRLMAAGTLATRTTIIAPRPTTADTVSGPGWSSIVTGVWSDKHLVLNNRLATSNFTEFPHWFVRLKQTQPQRQTVSLDGWGSIHQYMVTGADINESTLGADKDYAAADVRTLARAQTILREQQPDAMFVYFGNVDETGHRHGFHPTVAPYVAALEKVDEQIGGVLTSVRQRATFANEDWLTIVCTDHGGRGKDHGKGHDIPEINNVFLIVSGSSAQVGQHHEPTGLVDVVATSLVHLGVTLDPAWGLDGKPVGLKPR